MATRNKYRKLNLGPSEPITRRTSVQGFIVVGDYIDPLSNQRTLLLERPDALFEAQKPAAPKRKARRAKTNAQPSAPVADAGVVTGERHI